MNRKEVAGGLVMLAFATAYGATAADLPLRSALGIGPGLFPLILSVLLGAIALGLTAHGCLTGPGGEVAAPLPLRGLVLIPAAPIVFALTVTRLGLVPALVAAVFVAALASRKTSVPGAFVIGLAVTLFCALVFVWALGLPLPLLGPWLAAG
jgi:putative tricarboxylic transport membrane protein